jgi:hypothetical protein
MPYQAPSPATLPSAVHAVLAANRLEARPRSPEFNRALRAEIRDATWLLARQWQMQEFQAEDRGTPAFAQVALRALPLSQLALGGGPARPFSPAEQPLEAAVEAQPRPIGAGLRLQLGQLWRRVLRTLPALAPTATAGAERDARAAALARWATAFPLRPQPASAAVAFAQESTTPEVQALLALATPTAPLLDGYALYNALLQNFKATITADKLADSTRLEAALDKLPLAQRLLAQAPLADNSPATARLVGLGTALDDCARQFVLACHRLYLLGRDSAAWSTEDMAYDFVVGAAGDVALGTRAYPGGAALPWYAVDAQPALSGQPAASTVASTQGRRLATEVQFPGAPAARWWEFEDRRVDFGQVTGDPADWGRMLLQEFMFLYQNDWFSVPYTVPTGVVCALEQVLVTDVFGRTYHIQPAGAGALTEDDGATRIDYDAGRWRLFAQTDAAHPAAAPQLYVPAAAPLPLVGRPVEQVSFRREEATNLVWAVESIVPDGFAGGIDGATAAAQFAQALSSLSPAPAYAAPSGHAAPTYTYQLASSVPENWLPFVAVPRNPADATSPNTLEQGVLRRQVPGFTATEVQPRTSLLQLHPGLPYRLHEHEVPPAGLRVEGASYRVRWHDGRTLHWFGRRRGPAQVSGSSGLAFDQLR